MLKAEGKSAECTAEKVEKLKAERALKVEHIDRRPVSVAEHEAECIKKNLKKAARVRR